MATIAEGNKARLRAHIIRGAVIYDNYLNNKCFKIICDDSTEVLVRFFQKDYKHMTGIDSDLDDTNFYLNCKDGIISTGNILSVQKYNWGTLRRKSERIEQIHNLLYSNSDKSILLERLKVNTHTFPVAISNDAYDICVGFVGSENKARSLRKAITGGDVASEKQIVKIYEKNNDESDFQRIIYDKTI